MAVSEFQYVTLSGQEKGHMAKIAQILNNMDFFEKLGIGAVRHGEFSGSVRISISDLIWAGQGSQGQNSPNYKPYGFL